jgi:hypothetical protein
VSATTIKAVAATGDITTQTAYLRSVVLTAGADAASVVVKAGGSSGTTILTLKAAANASAATPDLGRVLCGSGIHVTLTGTAPAVSVVYE